MRIDATYAAVKFNYTDNTGKSISVTTLEELQYPNHFCHETKVDEGELPEGIPVNNTSPVASPSPVSPQSTTPELKEQHIVVMENQRGISYEKLFGPYLKGASHITITDPYIRLFYQTRNLMELLECIVKTKSEGDEVVVSLITVEDEFKSD